MMTFFRCQELFFSSKTYVFSQRAPAELFQAEENMSYGFFLAIFPSTQEYLGSSKPSSIDTVEKPGAVKLPQNIDGSCSRAAG